MKIHCGPYAHSLKNKPRELWHVLDAHLKAVAELADAFATAFGSGDWAYAAGLLHDVGKASDAFQAYLLRENDLDDAQYDTNGNGRINHSTTGAVLAERVFCQRMPIGRILAYLAAGHHAGLPDWNSSETGNAALQVRLSEAASELTHIADCANQIQSCLPQLSKPPPFVKRENFHLWVRMLFSALVDADFLDTEAFMQPDHVMERGRFSSLGSLRALLDDHVARFSPSTPVNVIRHEVLSACRTASAHTPGIFTLSVPTGGGKTLSGMAFALHHAIHHEKLRVIYVIPYTSIIEQTANTLRGILGTDNVVEHHSNLDPEMETQRSRLAAENWDAPVIVTTNVQFFESLHAAKSSRCRKLHNIVNSVVILDEAQLLPPEWLTPCVNTINDLARNYKVTFLLTTATQPALPGIDTPHEIIADVPRLYQRLKRTEIHIPTDLNERSSWEELAGQLLQHQQVLCVVNTRRDCYDLFRLLPAGTLHLSALMCGQHRSEVIEVIKQRIERGEPLRVISTQLVEAGVDIDFPVVYRALAGLDSIVQAAGRCNREGRHRSGNVHVFVPPKPSPKGLLQKGEVTTIELRALGISNLDSPDTFKRYFTCFYPKLNDTGAHWLQDLLVKDAPNAQFRTAGNEFRLIKDEHQRPVFVRYAGSDALLSSLQSIGPTRDVLRKLQRFTVNIPVSTVAELVASGLVEEIWPGYMAQCSLSLYDSTLGLDVFATRVPVENLIL